MLTWFERAIVRGEASIPLLDVRRRLASQMKRMLSAAAAVSSLVDWNCAMACSGGMRRFRAERRRYGCAAPELSLAIEAVGLNARPDH
jgi:hypothetical protein